MRWNDYTPFDPGVRGPLEDLPRPSARRVYDRLMAAKTNRIEALRSLTAANGLDLGESDDSVNSLNEWFVQNVEPGGDPTRLAPLWYSVAQDIGLFLGDLIIRRIGRPVHWALFDGPRRSIAFQRPVLMGFLVPNKLYNVDIIYRVADVGRDALQGDASAATKFLALVHAAVERGLTGNLPPTSPSSAPLQPRRLRKGASEPAQTRGGRAQKKKEKQSRRRKPGA